MAARRVVSVPSDNNGLVCPTGDVTPIENKAKKAALSNRKSGFNLGKFIKPEHKRMSRVLGYCLALGEADSWADFSALAAVRLSDAERLSLAFAALCSLDPDTRETVAGASLGASGDPMPAFLGGMNDARDWARFASRNELKAYALAAFDAMSAQDQGAFFQHISEVEIAA